jgi:hypothetical protein
VNLATHPFLPYFLLRDAEINLKIFAFSHLKNATFNTSLVYNPPEDFRLIQLFSDQIAESERKFGRSKTHEMESKKYLDCDGGGMPDLLAADRVGFILV